MSLACGVPDSSPVVVLNVAQSGRLSTLNVSGSLFGSDAVGMNEYAVPAMTDDGGVPLIVGVAFGSITVIEKAGSEAVETLSDTVIAMFLYVLSWPGRGVPAILPDWELNVAHIGMF